MAADPLREEAERLVAAAIGAFSMAARGLGAAGGFAGRTSGFATGSPECCVCPVCRLIATMRDPSSDLAERLATGAGDLAAGVSSMLRAVVPSGADRDATRDVWEATRRRTGDPEAFADGDPWHAATTGTAPPPKPIAKKAVAKKAVAKKVGKKAVSKKVTPPSEGE